MPSSSLAKCPVSMADPIPLLNISQKRMNSLFPLCSKADIRELASKERVSSYEKRLLISYETNADYKLFTAYLGQQLSEGCSGR